MRSSYSTIWIDSSWTVIFLAHRSSLFLADEWGAEFDFGDSNASNRLHDELQKTFSDIRISQREHELFDRVNRVGDAASFWIASHMKEANLPQARSVYERLTRSRSPSIALSAEYILKEMADDQAG